MASITDQVCKKRRMPIMSGINLSDTICKQFKQYPLLPFTVKRCDFYKHDQQI